MVRSGKARGDLTASGSSQGTNPKSALPSSRTKGSQRSLTIVYQIPPEGSSEDVRRWPYKSLRHALSAMDFCYPMLPYRKGQIGEGEEFGIYFEMDGKGVLSQEEVLDIVAKTKHCGELVKYDTGRPWMNAYQGTSEGANAHGWLNESSLKAHSGDTVSNLLDEIGAEGADLSDDSPTQTGAKITCQIHDRFQGLTKKAKATTSVYRKLVYAHLLLDGDGTKYVDLTISYPSHTLLCDSFVYFDARNFTNGRALIDICRSDDTFGDDFWPSECSRIPILLSRDNMDYNPALITETASKLRSERFAFPYEMQEPPEWIGQYWKASKRALGKEMSA